MDQTKMQKCADALAGQLSKAGFAKPRCQIQISSHSGPVVMLAHAKLVPLYYGEDEMKWFLGNDTKGLPEVLEEAADWIDAQVTPQERARLDALELSARAVEALEKAGLANAHSMAFVAELRAAMKALSENAITNQKGA